MDIDLGFRQWRQGQVMQVSDEQRKLLKRKDIVDIEVEMVKRYDQIAHTYIYYYNANILTVNGIPVKELHGKHKEETRRQIEAETGSI